KGPYRFLRHPMYAGYTLTHIGFLLGSFAAEFFALFHSLFDRSRAINAGGIDPESGPTLSRVRSSRALPITPGRFLVAGSINKIKVLLRLSKGLRRAGKARLAVESC